MEVSYNNKGKVKRWEIVAVILIVVFIALWASPIQVTPHFVFVSEAIHSVVEITKALAALMLVVIIVKLGPIGLNTRLIWPSIGIVGLGIMAGFIAITPIGNEAVFLHNSSVLVGGIGFSFSLLPATSRYNKIAKWSFWAVIVLALLCGIAASLKMNVFPVMIQEGQFTIIAVWMSIIAGILFMLGSLHFLRLFIRFSNREHFYVFIMALFLSLSAFVFPFSILWDEAFWAWHAGQLIAFLILVGILIDRYILLNNALLEKVQEHGILHEILKTQHKLSSVGQLIADIAHEINTPLADMVLYSRLILERELPDDIRKYVEIINQEGIRTASLVTNFLTFIRPNDEKIAKVDINSGIRQIVGMRDIGLQDSNISYNLNLDEHIPEVMGNMNQLKQVFLNMIINAEHSMLEAHNKGVLTVTTELAGEMVRVSFADNGRGISPEDMKKLFTPFYTTKPEGQGTGLGLSISKSIVTSHGGTIVAKSELGKGATFIIELPHYAPPKKNPVA